MNFLLFYMNTFLFFDTYIYITFQIEPTQECMKAIQKRDSCPACQGFAEIKPCSNYCINVMKGCLVFHIELQKHWDQFLDALSQLTERLQGPFNLGGYSLKFLHFIFKERI